jgi:hypothetical protein
VLGGIESNSTADEGIGIDLYLPCRRPKLSAQSYRFHEHWLTFVWFAVMDKQVRNTTIY